MYGCIVEEGVEGGLWREVLLVRDWSSGEVREEGREGREGEIKEEQRSKETQRNNRKERETGERGKGRE